MLLRENELGWRLYKTAYGFAIKQPHVPLRSHLGQLGPVALNLLLVAVVWLVGRDTKRIESVLGILPFTLLMGLYCFRPGILGVRPRRRTLGDTSGGVPFGWLRIEVGKDSENQLHTVYLKGAEPLETTGTRTCGWKRLVWESTTEAEASALAEEFRAWGIGTPDPVTLIVKGNRPLRLLAYAGHILSLVALIALIFRMGHGRAKGLVDADPIAILRIVQIIIAFVFLSMLPFAVYLFRLGRGAVRCGRLPPPGMRVLSDMKLIEDHEAVQRGRRMATIGFVLIVIGLIGGLYVPYKIGTLYGEPLRPTTPAASRHK
jgi:hypothetical protein